MIKQRIFLLFMILFLGSLCIIPNTFAAQDQQKLEFSFQGISMGQALQEVLDTLGEPNRQDLSEYGFTWYIYNQDYTKYLQVGIENERVVALYTNAADWHLASELGFDSTKLEVEQHLGQPLTSIKKGNTIFQYTDSGEEYGLYLLDGVYVTLFYDVHNADTVTAIQLVAAETELAFTQFYGEPSEELQAGFERQVFDLANSVRARAGKEILTWNEQIATTARKHSWDMMARNYFAHQTPEGRTPFERMKADGLTYKQASENIAAGQTSAIFVHESWMNSLGHRQNILGDFSHLGVGITFGGSWYIYYTQNFFTPTHHLALLNN